MQTKWFIKRDFIGWPVAVISAEYDDEGNLASTSFVAPKKLSKKFPGFDTLEELEGYKMCKCGKDDCKVNMLLNGLVIEKLKSRANAN